MKKILSAVISLLFVSMAFGQAKAPIACPPGLCPFFNWTLTTFNFHKPRTDCKTGFGLCIRGGINSGCGACNTYRDGDDATRISDGTVYGWGQINNNKIELHIPIEIKADLNLSDSETSTFSLDRGALTFTTNNKTYTNKQGVFPVEIRENDLVVLIDME